MNPTKAALKQFKALARKAGFKLPVAKSLMAADELDERRAKELWTEGFQGLKQDTVYWDPMGARTDGMKVNLRPHMRDQVSESIKAFDRVRSTYGSFQAAVKAYQDHPQTKTLVTSTWNIPVHAIPRVRMVNPGYTPLATLVARQVETSATVHAHATTTIGTSNHIAEADADYTFTDDVYHGGTKSDYTQSITGYGRGSKTSDLIQLAGSSITSPRRATSATQLQSIRRFEEIQLFQGRHTGGNFSGNASSFKGIYEFATGTGGYNVDGSSIKYPNDVRLMINSLLDAGADKRFLVGATDYTTLTNIANSLQQFVRTQSPMRNFVFAGNEMDMEIPYVDIDGVKIFMSMGAPTVTTAREIVMCDYSSHFMSMCQDATLKPLGKVGPHDDFATDAYGCFTTEARPHNGRIHTIT